ncbi:hypothetical protein BAE44_0001249, partial [Dichanthelium oligosanthes]
LRKMAKLAVLVTFVLLVVVEAIMLPVHGARTLESVELVTVREVSSVAKPPSSTTGSRGAHPSG